MMKAKHISLGLRFLLGGALLYAIVVMSGSGLGQAMAYAEAPSTLAAHTDDADTLAQEVYINVLAVGDIMLGTNYPPPGDLPPNDARALLEPVAHIIRSADLAFANLEGVLLTGEGKAKQCLNPALCYAFKSPDHYVHRFTEAGFDMLSLGNNHSNDFGEPGRKNTIRLLDAAGIQHAGLLERPTAIFEHQGLRIGFAAFSPNRATVKLNDHKAMRGIVADLKSKVDIVIVSMHAGGEGKKYQHITRKKEYYADEDRGNPYQFARDAIDAGADLVFGHGPHVPRAVDLYHGRFIAYSLGNFATYSAFNLTGENGLAPMIMVKVNAKGEFLEAQIISAKQVGKGGPIPDPTHAATRKIASLTAADFPTGHLDISETGAIRKK